jgi:hypothetical protein
MDEIKTQCRTPRRSDSIAALAGAFAKAQGQFGGAKKDSANPFFKSKYADLASVWDAVRDPLAAHGLAIMQFPRSTDAGVEVETMLTHESGEWISETLALPAAKADAQGLGSAITYARRYGLQSICGVAPEDDDGNSAAKSIGDLRQKGLNILVTAAEKGTPALEQAWRALSNDMRAACKTDLDGLKKTAAEHDHASSRA